MQNSTFYLRQPIDDIKAAFSDLSSPAFKAAKKKSVTSRDDTRGKFPFSFSGGRESFRREREKHARRVQE